MTDVTAERKLVKSRPELWAEVSEVESLARHLGELGEIRITKVEPESTVAWEGEQIRGTVELEQSGWGTKVTLSATVPEPDQAGTSVDPERTSAKVAPPVDLEPTTEAIAPPVEPEPSPILPPDEEPDPEPIEIPTPGRHEPDPAADAPAEDVRPGFWKRLLRRRRPDATTAAEPEDVVEPQPVAEPQPAVEPEAGVEPPVTIATPAPKVAIGEGAGVDAERVQEILDGTLDALGQAHHRPFSRS
ncbi:MAG: hypothetical protein WD993_05340 [Thermoleophilaceae bacterium]